MLYFVNLASVLPLQNEKTNKHTGLNQTEVLNLFIHLYVPSFCTSSFGTEQSVCLVSKDQLFTRVLARESHAFL